MNLSLFPALALAALLASCAHQGERPRVAAGHRLAQRHCGECHAIDGTGKSALADAPPFRDLPGRFPLDQFTRAYADGMFEHHPRMPRMELGPDELTELQAYLSSLLPRTRSQ